MAQLWKAITTPIDVRRAERMPKMRVSLSLVLKVECIGAMVVVSIERMSKIDMLRRNE